MAPNPTQKRKIHSADRISSLPDPIIHHILSFLPSTLTAVRTCVLSTRWQYQWTYVLVLIFDSDIPQAHFSTFVNSVLVLHSSPTITKFVLKVKNFSPLRSQFPVWIRFALQKQVKELTLHLEYCESFPDVYKIPRFVFNNDSLVTFDAFGLDFETCGQVNWPSLKALSVESCDGLDEAIGKIVSGCPLLESLHCMCTDWFDPVVIASKSLKRLVVGWLRDSAGGFGLEIACPNLEELEFSYTFYFDCFKLVDLPSSARVTFDLHEIHIKVPRPTEELEQCDENRVQRVLQSVKHVDVLNIGGCFLQVFSVWVAARSLSCPLMKTKCLSLDVWDFDTGLPGIVSILSNSPSLEKLTLDFEYFQPLRIESYDFGEKYWNLQENVLDFSLSHLKTIEIFGLMERHWEDQHKLTLRFLKLLVKSSKSLEEIAMFRQGMTEEEICNCRSGENFALEHFDYLLSLQRCNPGVIVSVSCCKAHAIVSRNGASRV